MTMEWQENRLIDYHCPKCRNARAIVRKVNLAKGILPELLIRGGGKYLFITCSLCGYTEIYDQALYARNELPEEGQTEARRLAPDI